MMTTRFIPLTQEETLKHHPRYFREDIACFQILKDQTPVGLYGLIDRGVENSKEGNHRIGEGFLTIFPAFRYRTLSKEFFLKLFDHAFESGFDKVYTWTRLPSWQKVLGRFRSVGIHRLDVPPPWNLDSSDLDPTRVWFVKEKNNSQEKGQQEACVLAVMTLLLLRHPLIHLFLLRRS